MTLCAETGGPPASDSEVQETAATCRAGLAVLCDIEGTGLAQAHFTSWSVRGQELAITLRGGWRLRDGALALRFGERRNAFGGGIVDG